MLWLNGCGKGMSTSVHSQTIVLLDLLQKMNVCATELEHVAEQEQEATRHLDANTLMKLSEERVVLYETLTVLENACRSMVYQAEGSKDMSLSVFIDLCSGSSAGELQALRREAYQRLMQASKADKNSLIHMHATYEVTSSVLQEIGVLEKKNTYGPGGVL